MSTVKLSIFSMIVVISAISIVSSHVREYCAIERFELSQRYSARMLTCETIECIEELEKEQDNQRTEYCRELDL